MVNCPFHELVDEDRQSVCSMNRAMLDAAATQLHSARVASLEPRDSFCCVGCCPSTCPARQPDVHTSTVCRPVQRMVAR